MGDSDQPALFLADDEISQRLEQVENALANFEATVPTLRREITEIRQRLAAGTTAR